MRESGICAVFDPAKAEGSQTGLRNIEFIVREPTGFDATGEAGEHDLITTFGAIPDQARPLDLPKGIHRALKPGGWSLMQDIRGSSDLHRKNGHPIATFLDATSTLRCMTVSLPPGGEGVGAMCGEEMTRESPRKTGFRHVQTNRLAHDIQNNWYVVRK